METNWLFLFLPISCGILSQLCRIVFGALEPSVMLDQGPVVGVKIYPESSRIPIDAFLGIPYAAPPTGRLRFAPPEKHRGWSRTLYAQQFSPGCIPLQSSKKNMPSYSLQPPPLIRQYSEDCLYLNVWVPDNRERRGKVPVLIIYLSEWLNGPPIDLPGQDMAAEGLVVVTVNYRISIFGFLSLGTPEARGNLGLLDQYFSMIWVRENIERFGGDPEKVTLLGHSAGAVSIIYHMTSPRTKALFGRAILMSGNMGVLWSDMDVVKASVTFTSLMGCHSVSAKESIQCLREKSTDDIYKVIQSQQSAGNWSDAIGPTSDEFLSKNDQYLPIKPRDALSSGNFHQIPILIGLTNLEASDSIDHWQDLARQSYHQLRHYVDFTAIPDIMAQHNLNMGPNYRQIKEIIKWNYLDQQSLEGDVWSLLRQLIILYTDTQYEAPHSKLLSILAKTSKPLYVYKYHQSGGVDLYGSQLNTTGAGHTSDLPYLFGPTLFQQITRRRLSQQEERLSRKLKVMWTDFVKFGYPMSPLQYNAWKIYTILEKQIQQLGNGDGVLNESRGASLWNNLIPQLTNISNDREDLSALNLTPNSEDSNETIRHAMYTLLGLVLALAGLLVICLVLLKRFSKERKMNRDFGTF